MLHACVGMPCRLASSGITFVDDGEVKRRSHAHASVEHGTRRGRVGMAAEAAGISPRTLHGKMKKHGFDKKAFK